MIASQIGAAADGKMD